VAAWTIDNYEHKVGPFATVTADGAPLDLKVGDVLAGPLALADGAPDAWLTEWFARVSQGTPERRTFLLREAGGAGMVVHEALPVRCDAGGVTFTVDQINVLWV
jgi:hypothetical protein